MKKTKLSFICVFMVVCILGSAVLTGCNSGENIDDGTQGNRPAITLTLLTIVEDSTTPEAIAEVEDALNEITEARFTTRIKLIGLTADKYLDEINRRFELYDAAQEKLLEEASIKASLDKVSKDIARQNKLAGITEAPTKRPTEPPKTTELYTERIIWPKTTGDQIDIFLINSSEMFYQLLEDDRLEGIDDDLSTKAKVLKEYLHPSVMMAGQYKERTYAIPTNKAVGTAVYLAVNKRLAAKYELDLTKVKEYQHLTEFLEAVKSGDPDIALIEGPFVPLKNYEPLFPEMPYFAAVSNLPAVGASRPLVYTPEQEPTDPPTKAPTEPPTDDEGNLVTEDPANTTIPGTTVKPKNIPAATNLTPANISITNKYTHAAFVTIANLNQEFKEKGLFETSPVADGRERAAYILQGTLEEQMAAEAADLANGFEYEYILYENPIASKAELQSAMYGISVSSKIPVMRAMEIVTLMNTNKAFKNTFQYGKLGTHYVYNDNGRIERLNNDYMIKMDYTGNNFIADLYEGDNPNKWEIAMTHNLNLVNSVFMNFYFDKTKLTAESEEAIPKINALSEQVYPILINGNIPPEYESIDDYIAGYVDPEFAAAGWAEFNADIKLQTNPPSD